MRTVDYRSIHWFFSAPVTVVNVGLDFSTHVIRSGTPKLLLTLKENVLKLVIVDHMPVLKCFL